MPYAMAEEDVVEDYRRAGKLHKYDPTQVKKDPWKKRTRKNAPGSDTTGNGQAAVTGTAAAAVVPPPEELIPEERLAAFRFLKALCEDALAYTEMSDEEVEEYRRAGKLHRYDPDKEWKKRYARIGRKYPPPKGIGSHLDEYIKYLEEDEADDEAPPSAN